MENPKTKAVYPRTLTHSHPLALCSPNQRPRARPSAPVSTNQRPPARPFAIAASTRSAILWFSSSFAVRGRGGASACASRLASKAARVLAASPAKRAR
jgi:hypothetical protein